MNIVASYVQTRQKISIYDRENYYEIESKY